MRVNLCIFPGLSFLWHANAHFILDSAIEKEFSERVSPRATQKDPEDLSHIKNWTALGDSFAAGIGAGKQLGSIAIHHQDWICSRWGSAYPFLMDKAEHFGEGKREFRSLACSGYTSTQIKENQVPLLTDKSQQLITLSAGGNDANVSHIIDACVYQITPGVALSDKCDEALEETADIINRNLGDSLDDLYNALKPKLADGAKIFHTGYARYWNADTDQCDDVTRAFWKDKYIPFLKFAYLTKERRKKMNDLTIAVNDKIQETIVQRDHGDRVVFVDVDPYVSLLQGRFCEPGITEPSPNRTGLLFYDGGTDDGPEDSWRHSTSDHTDLRRDAEELPPDSFEGQMARKFLRAFDEFGSIQVQQNALANFSVVPTKASTAVATNVSAAASVMSFAASNVSLPAFNVSFPATNLSGVAVNVSGAANDVSTQASLSDVVPDGYKRVFHPRIFLHGVMARLTLFHIVNDHAHSMGLPHGPPIIRAKVPSEEYCERAPVGPPRELQCFERPYSVRKEKTTDGSASVLDAINHFCKARHGQEVKHSNAIYDRWDISGFGQPKRQSMWIRASPGPYDQCMRSGPVWERDCVNVLTGGLRDCHQKSEYSHGFKGQGENCLEYMVDMSASIHEGDPPWNEHVVKYPPPETVKPYNLAPVTNKEEEGKLEIYVTADDYGMGWNFESARMAQAHIKSFCTNGLDNSPENKLTIKWLTIWTQGGPWGDEAGPYKDDGWCQGVDHKKKNAEDCKYAFTKLLTKVDKQAEGRWYYRCVGYYVRTYPMDAEEKVTWYEDGGRYPFSNNGPMPIFIGEQPE